MCGHFRNHHLWFTQLFPWFSGIFWSAWIILLLCKVAQCNRFAMLCFVCSQKKHENKRAIKKEKMEEENIYQVNDSSDSIHSFSHSLYKSNAIICLIFFGFCACRGSIWMTAVQHMTRLSALRDMVRTRMWAQLSKRGKKSSWKNPEGK